MKANVRGDEWYPVWSVQTDLDEGERVYEVPKDLVLEAQQAAHDFARVQRKLRAVVDPPCPDCDHPKSRHQYSEQGSASQEPGTTICLFRDRTRCRCTTAQPTNPNLIEETHA